MVELGSICRPLSGADPEGVVWGGGSDFGSISSIC